MEDALLLDRYRGCVLGSAIGDALGMATEWTVGNDAQSDGFVQEYRAGHLAAGCYTDDTQQSLILAESLLENRGYDRDRYVRKLMRKTNPKRGLGPSLRRFLLSEILKENNGSKDSAESVDSIEREGRNSCASIPQPSNGLAMKIAPVALYFRRAQEMLPTIEQLAALTHPHPGSLAGAVGIATGIHYILSCAEQGSPFQSDAFIDAIVLGVRKYEPDMARIIATGRIIDDLSCNVYTTVPNAICAFATGPTQFRGGMIRMVNSGGDTDTKAAMYGALSGAYNGYSRLPANWINGLEDGKEGRMHLLKVAEELYREHRG